MAPTVVPKYAVLPSDISSNLKDKIEFESNNKTLRKLRAKTVCLGSSIEKAFYEFLQNPKEDNCVSAAFSIKLQTEACNFIRKETLSQVFSCYLCEIF